MTESDEHQEALETALNSVTLGDEYAATIQLARWYAAILDFNPAEPELAKTLGPLYLATLSALGMTKAAAAKPAEGGASHAGNPALVGLRDRARQRYAQGVHPAAG